MTSHVSATVREEAPHATRTTISDAFNRRAQAVIVDTVDFSQPPIDGDSSNAKIEALAEIICGASDESAAALLVLMGKLQNSGDPKVLANTAKHFAFTRCGELNLFGMVDAQISLLEGELFRE